MRFTFWAGNSQEIASDVQSGSEVSGKRPSKGWAELGGGGIY